MTADGRSVPDMPIAIGGYDAAWPDRFAEQQGALTELLAPWLAGPVQHVGSTAVPGLRAKPIIDMLAPVRSLRAARAAVPVLARHDWLFWPEDPARTYRLWFLRPAPAKRTHHLQVIEHDDPHAIALLGFRDALRGDARLRREYAELKEGLARQHADNRNAYTNAKNDFVAQVLRHAGLPVPHRDTLPE
jgi:GrpB-like predicted nucleotidyltransferase (UPF0157 family)